MSNEELIEPLEIRLKDSAGQLGIDWNDGHTCAYPLSYLRELCQCAMCINEWTRERQIPPGSIPADIKIENLSAVGRYALNFQWSDGHDTGIYTFEFLREICPCSACGGPKLGIRST